MVSGDGDSTTAGTRAYAQPTRVGWVVGGIEQPPLRYMGLIVGPRSRDGELWRRAEAVLDSLWPLYAR
jgi:hypothetical protein